jgi:hypothetical protein
MKRVLGRSSDDLTGGGMKLTLVAGTLQKILIFEIVDPASKMGAST